MRRIGIALALGILIQAVPANVLAIFVPHPGGLIAILGLTGAFDGGNTKDSSLPKREFDTLNQTSGQSALTSQSAGGELNTLDIIKK